MRYELTDCEWAAISPMLPTKPRGRRTTTAASSTASFGCCDYETMMPSASLAPTITAGSQLEPRNMPENVDLSGALYSMI
jgi:transposase